MKKSKKFLFTILSSYLRILRNTMTTIHRLYRQQLMMMNIMTIIMMTITMTTIQAHTAGELTGSEQSALLCW